jgi:hypothetical protein
MKPTETAGSNPVALPPRYAEPAPSRTVPLALSLLAALAAGAVLFLFNPSEHSFYPFCLFYRTTGLLCPGCGGLRAMHQLLHGHLAAAFRFNALFICSLPFLGWWGLRCVLARIRHQPAPMGFRPAWLWFGFAVLVLFGILRNLPFAQQVCLAP